MYIFSSCICLFTLSHVCAFPLHLLKPRCFSTSSLIYVLCTSVASVSALRLQTLDPPTTASPTERLLHIDACLFPSRAPCAFDYEELSLPVEPRPCADSHDSTSASSSHYRYTTKYPAMSTQPDTEHL